MKLLVNIAAERLSDALAWTRCEGVRLVELDDGSFDLQMSRDIESSIKADADLKASEAEMARLLGRDT